MSQSVEERAGSLTLSIAKHASAGSFDFNAAYAFCLDALAACERDTIERCAATAEATTRHPMDYIGWSPGPAADDRARIIAVAIRALATPI